MSLRTQGIKGQRAGDPPSELPPLFARRPHLITILEDAEIEELYGRPRFTHDERVHYFALTPEERAVADGHYSLASRVLFILQEAWQSFSHHFASR
jgi:hypothetical protein